MKRIDNSDLTVAVHSLMGTAKGTRTGEPRRNLDRYIVQSFQLLEGETLPITLAAVARPCFWWMIDEKDISFPPSEIVLDRILEKFDQFQSGHIVELLEQAFNVASIELRSRGVYYSVVASAAVVRNCKLYIASCGNCCVFLIRSEKAQMISIIHSLEQIWIDAGHVTAEQLISNPYTARGSLRSLGSREEFSQPDMRLRLSLEEDDEQMLSNQGLELQQDDRIVLTSGGVFGYFLLNDDLNHLEQSFADTSRPLQDAVDDFMKPLIERKHRHSDMTVVALQV